MDILLFAAGVCVGALIIFLTLGQKSVEPIEQRTIEPIQKVSLPDHRKAYQFSDPAYKNELQAVTRKVKK